MKINNVKLLTPTPIPDFRGYLSISYDTETAKELDFKVVQINQGFSKKIYTLRGLHFQEEPFAQAKLVSCLVGSMYNVAVDIRKDSPTFGQCVTEILTGENHKMMYIPKGYAHGYLTLEDNTLIQWCVDAVFHKESAKCILWNSVEADWPLDGHQPILSDKDKNGIMLKDYKNDKGKF